MQAAGPAALKRRLRQRARRLVHGIEAAPATGQTETAFDAGGVARRMPADRQSAMIVDTASPAKADMQRITCDPLMADAVKKGSLRCRLRSASCPLWAKSRSAACAKYWRQSPRASDSISLKAG